jgi:hypothetical protein
MVTTISTFCLAFALLTVGLTVARGQVKTMPFIDNFAAEWPATAGADSTVVATVFKEDEKRQAFIYHSPHYEFVCDAKLNTSVVTKFARMFEATLDYCKALPLSMQKAHRSGTGNKQRVMLFKDKSEYIRSGGSATSAGVFISDQSLILLPLESLGVIASGSSFRLDYDKANNTLAHEITHQLTDASYFVSGARGWFTEGLADYVAITPYTSSGTYKVRSNLEPIIEYVTGKARANGKQISMMPLRQWMLQPYTAFMGDSGVNYGVGCLVTYYFFHLDGNGDRKAITAFLRSLRQGKEGEEALGVLRMGRTWKQLAEDISRAWNLKGVNIDWENDED